MSFLDKTSQSTGSNARFRLSLLKKSVLLVDTNAHSRELRAKTLRTFGVAVHCSGTGDAAREELDAGSYDLILIDPGADVNAAESLAAAIRLKNPRQLIGFLVGSPLFVAPSLRGGASASTPAAELPMAVREQASVFDFGSKVRDAEEKARLR